MKPTSQDEQSRRNQCYVSNSKVVMKVSAAAHKSENKVSNCKGLPLSKEKSLKEEVKGSPVVVG